MKTDKNVSDTQRNMRPNQQLAKHLAIRDIPALVYESVNLEDIAISLPEVQTIALIPKTPHNRIHTPHHSPVYPKTATCHENKKAILFRIV